MCKNNPYTPSVLSVGHMQTVQIQMSSCKMQHLIKVSNIAIQNLNKNESINTTQQPLNWNGLVQLKIVGIDDNEYKLVSVFKENYLTQTK